MRVVVVFDGEYLGIESTPTAGSRQVAPGHRHYRVRPALRVTRLERSSQDGAVGAGYFFFRLSPTPLAALLASWAVPLTAPLARSVLPSASVRLSPVSLPAPSFTAPLTLSVVPAMAHLRLIDRA